MDLALIAAAVIAAGILIYIVLDGFDLGVGILFPFAPDDTARDVMMNSVAPVWDGNETWLVLGGGGLLVFFPLAYSTVLPAFYFPVMILLFALIFRGVAFEFRHSAHKQISLGPRLLRRLACRHLRARRACRCAHSGRHHCGPPLCRRHVRLAHALLDPDRAWPRRGLRASRCHMDRDEG